MRPVTGLLALGLVLSASLSLRATAEAGPRKATPLRIQTPATGPRSKAEPTGFGRPSAGAFGAATAPTGPLDAPPNDQCGGAIPIPCGNISLSGNTINAANDYDFPDTTLSCTGYSAGGHDVVYSFAATAGDSVWLRYQSSADASMYIVTDCGNVTGSCVAGSDNTRSGDTESLNYGFKTTGTYYLILDSYGQNTFGTWTLVGQFLSCGFHAPPNDRCDTAFQLQCGNIITSGSTATAFNDYSFPSLSASCVNSLAQGNDVVYRMMASAGDSIALNYTSTTQGVMYLMTGCDVGPGTCVTGAVAPGPNTPAVLNYRFTFTGTYFLVLDSDAPGSSGSFTLNGTFTCVNGPPVNDQCSGAPPIYCGPFSLSGSTALAQDDYDLLDTGCTGFTTQGPDVAYRIDAAPGESLYVDYTSTADGSVYLVTDCSNVNGSCVAGSDNGSTGETEHLEYKFPTQQTYYLIFDSYEFNVPGNWIASGAILCPNVAGVEAQGAAFRMGAPAPNPFASTSTVRFTLPSRGPATLRIYDLAGRVVRTLLDQDLAGGDHTVTWDARDDAGQRVHVGTYFARLMAGGHTAYRTLVFVH